MADETPQAPAQQPAQPQQGQAVPQPQAVIRPPATAAQARPAPLPEEESPRAKAARLRREAAEIERSLPQVEGTVRVRVNLPHSEFHFGGVHIGNEFVPVNAALLADVMQAADNSGVELITEG
jgi:hypothetical protein